MQFSLVLMLLLFPGQGRFREKVQGPQAGGERPVMVKNGAKSGVSQAIAKSAIRCKVPAG